MQDIEIIKNALPDDSLKVIKHEIVNMKYRYMSSTTNYQEYLGIPITNTQIQDYSCMINTLYHETLMTTPDSSYEIIINQFRKHLPEVFNGYTVRRMNINVIPNNANFDSTKFSVPHIDDYPTVGEEFKTILFYVFNADGDTFFFNNKFTQDYLNQFSNNNINNIIFNVKHRQTPEHNCAVIFKGDILHSSQAPKLAKERIVINIVLRKKKMKSIDIHEPFRTPIFEFENFLTSEERNGLETKILSYKSQNNGRKYSNYGGWQSNLFLKNSYPIELQAFIMKIEIALDQCFESIGIANSVKENSITIGNVDCFWFNVNQRGDWNYPHTHPNNVFAAVLYIKCDDYSGDLIFERPDNLGEYYGNRIDLTSHYSLTQFKIKPKQSSLVVFPAWLKHAVEPSKSDITRISVAFNIQ